MNATVQAAQAIALSELPPGSGEGAAAVADRNPLHDIQARLRVSVGELELSIGQLLAARAGEVFTLDRTIQQPVDLLLEGRVVMRGQLVAVDGHFGVRVTELAVPLKP